MKIGYDIIRSKDRYKASHGWLTSYHLFSFADYYDPDNISFGNLRVFNDDYILGKSGFPLHPHQNMEILTIVLSGEITHSDSMGNKEKTKTGEIQKMSAGTGIFHSEINEGEDMLHLYQLWFLPKIKDIKPKYNNVKINIIANTLNLIYGENENTDVKVYEGKYEDGKSFEYIVGEGKGLFLYITSGKITITNLNQTLEKEDQIRIYSKGDYFFEILDKNTMFILIEVSF